MRRLALSLWLAVGATLALAAGCDDATVPAANDAPSAEQGLGQRQLRLLTRREYDQTVNDLLFADAAPTATACAVTSDCDVRSESCVASACVEDPCNLVTFVLPASASQYASVVAAGSFNGWATSVDAGGLALAYEPKLSAWVGKHVIEDGSWPYKLVADGTIWLADPENSSTEPDGFGGVNSLLTVSCASEPPPSDPASETYSKSFPVESRPEHFPFDNAAESGLVTSVHVEQYLRAGAQIADRATIDVDALLACTPSGADDPCVQEFIESFGRRAFRRPLSDDELGRYGALVSAQSSLDVGLRVLLRVMLSSPEFLYRSEVGELDGDVARLSAWEVATLLSYSFLGTTPDEELLDAAESGELDDSAVIEQQARRLLDDPRARSLVGTFALQWLGVERIVSADKSATLFPAFDRELSEEMADETRRFVEGVVFDSGRFEDLFTADSTVASPRLAELYGADAGGLLPEARQAGLLAHGSVLASYAHSDQTSPVRRGLFVRSRLMCMELGAPPANAGAVPEVDPNSSTRERFEQHSASPSCASCHRNIDPVGFGFEHFDAIGAFREEDAGQPVDASGELTYPEGWEVDAATVAFTTLPELGAVLADSPQVKRCFVRQLQRFVSGRLETEDDEGTLADLEQRFEASEYRPRELLVALTQTRSFVYRRKQ